MGVHPALREFLHAFHQVTMPALRARGHKLTPLNSREAYARMTAGMAGELVDVPQIYDDMVPGGEYSVPVRIYHPAPDEALPVLVDFHGGGYMVGSVTVYDHMFRKMAARTRHIVVAPEYRLTPECPYPAGCLDGFNVVSGLWPVLDGRGVRYKRELSITGDSAGGGICAYISGRAQHEPGVSIKSQVHVYPGVDFTMRTESMRLFGQDYFLTEERIRYYIDNFFQNGEDRHALSPVNGVFTRYLPPTLVIAAGHDPLRDEGRLYAEKVKAAGVYTEYVCMEGMIHAFMNFEKLLNDEIEQVYATINKFLHTAF